MAINRVATLRSDVARLWELVATHMVHTVTLYSVVRSIMLFIIAVSLTWPAHSEGSKLGS